MAKFLTFVAAAILFGACGPREAGPLDTDGGGTTYWRVTESDVTFDDCSDAESWRSEIQAPTFEENTFLIYRLSEDLTEATVQDCVSTDASTCGDDDPLVVFHVAGHVLSYAPPAETSAVTGSTCELEITPLWTVVDGGEEATFTVDLPINLLGDPTECADLDQRIKDDSDNGLGFDGCTPSLIIGMEFHSTQ